MPSRLKEHFKAEKWAAAAPLVLRNLVAMLSGVGTILTLNILTPTEFFRVRFAMLMGEGPLFILAAFTTGGLLLTLASVAVTHLVLRPLSRWLEAGGPQEEEQPLLRQARLCALGLPSRIAFWDMVVWVFFAGAMVGVAFTALGANPGFVAFFVFRGLMVGLMSASLAFLLVEGITRRRIIPMVFPKGGIVKLAGGRRIQVNRRIHVLLLLGTVIPLLILSGTIGLATLDLPQAGKNAREFGWELFLFAVVLSGLFFFLLFRLNRQIGESITGPLSNIRRALNRVMEGDYSYHIPVVSNDELGEVSEAANQMIAGLAEKEWIREAFGKYVTPEIRDEILAGNVSLEGERRVATVLFADLRGFTPFVENNLPEEVIAAMRDYFTSMHQEIRRQGGVVLQFVGDEIEAVFGVPLHLDDHADRAVAAALAMREALVRLNKRRQWDGKSPFAHGIGVHTGPVLAGNSGSYDQMSYSLIGETVNVASRIQGLTKEMKHDILISQETHQAASGGFQAQIMPQVDIRGYSRPVTVYKVL